MNISNSKQLEEKNIFSVYELASGREYSQEKNELNRSNVVSDEAF